MAEKMSAEALEAAYETLGRPDHAGDRLTVRSAIYAYLQALSPGSTGSAEVTEAMIEAGHEAALAWTDRYMDGAEFVNWQQGLPDIYRAMIDAAGGRDE